MGALAGMVGWNVATEGTRGCLVWLLELLLVTLDGEALRIGTKERGFPVLLGLDEGFECAAALPWRGH